MPRHGSCSLREAAVSPHVLIIDDSEDFRLLVSRYITEVRLPDAVPTVAAASILVAAAILASVMPAARASRVDVLQALRSE